VLDAARARAGGILYFDVARHAWHLWPEAWPEPVVSSPPVPFGEEWVFVSGEIRAGHRTAAVMAWHPGILADYSSVRHCVSAAPAKLNHMNQS